MAKRRPSGDGMVRKKEDGSWEGRVVIGYDEKNLPKTKNVLAKTKSECVEKLKQLQEQYAPPKSDKIKLEISGGSSATKRSILSIARTGSNTPPAFPNPPRRSCWSAWSCSAICALRSIPCPKRRVAGWMPV